MNKMIANFSLQKNPVLFVDLLFIENSPLFNFLALTKILKNIKNFAKLKKKEN